MSASDSQLAKPAAACVRSPSLGASPTAATRILLVAPRYHTNQVELVTYLKSTGADVSFWVTGIGQSEDHCVIQPRMMKTTVLAKTRSDPLSIYKWGLVSLADLRELVARKPELIVIRNPFTLVGFTFAVLARFLGARIIFYTQRDLHRPRRPSKDLALTLALRVFRAVWITPCRGDQQHGIPVRPMLYVPFCSPPVHYRKAWFEDGYVNIVCVGKFLPRKRHALLMKALELLQDRHQFRLRLIGEVSENTGKAVYEGVLQAARHVSFPVEIYTNLKRQEVFALFKRSDLFVLPARDEPASVSNLEAMAHGLPVLTSTTNKTSCYTHGNGLVFESDSLQDLAIKLEQLLADREQLTRMGERSVRLVEQNHSPHEVYGGLLRSLGL